jgi:molecular chaperone DnaJ
VDPRRDYYEILGVPRDADAQAIKSAFRSLALRYHPDRSREPDAEERFKEIAEAYAVLGNAEKRAQYDAHGFAGVSGLDPEDVFAGLDLDDLFGGLGFDLGGGGLFDHFFGRRRRGPPRGAHVEVEVHIPLATVVHGGEHRLRVEHPRRCDGCDGSGAKRGTTPRSCDACGGTGQQTSTRREGNVHVQQLATCRSCGGRGRFVDDPCPACRGSGQVADAETLTLQIPVGVREGMALRVPGKGMPPPSGGGMPGDLHVIVRTLPDPRFLRRGDHLWHEAEISLVDAVLGAALDVPTLDGIAHLTVPAGSQPGTVLRLRGKGLPAFGGRERGDLYVPLRLRVPERLSAEEQALWEQLRALAKGSPCSAG